MDLGLKNKRALVAGASAGLGFACAKALYAEGARVALCSRNRDRIEKAGASLSKDRKLVLPVACDLTRADQIHRLIANVGEAFESVDILVTNCGGPPAGTHETVTEEEWGLGWNLTFMSTVRLIQGIIPGMKRQRFGRIILLSSMSAKQPVDNLLLSNAYRAGLLGYAKTLANELAPHGITVNTVLPGYTRTERLNELAESISTASGRPKEDILAGWVAAVPAGRIGKPDDLGQFIAYLASEQAGYITGTVTAIDGGRSASIF